jgi:uncharacterized cupin superfamily protein
MADPRHPNVVNVEEAPERTVEKGTRFGCRTRRLGAAGGSRALGCSWYEVPPGKRAFPFHFHTANEEAVYVLEGAGTLRLGDAEVAIRAGDWIGLVPGPEHPHQIVNTGAGPLRYLCLSTMLPTEVVGYPDSNKLGVLVWGQNGPAIRTIPRIPNGGTRCAR